MLGFMPSRTVILCFISLYGPRISSSWLPRSLPQMASSTGRPTRQQPTTSSREKLSSRVQAAAAARRKPLLRYKIWSHSRHLPHHRLSSRCLLSNSVGMAAVSSVHDFIVKVRPSTYPSSLTNAQDIYVLLCVIQKMYCIAHV